MTAPSSVDGRHALRQSSRRRQLSELLQVPRQLTGDVVPLLNRQQLSQHPEHGARNGLGLQGSHAQMGGDLPQEPFAIKPLRPLTWVTSARMHGGGGFLAGALPSFGPRRHGIGTAHAYGQHPHPRSHARAARSPRRTRADFGISSVHHGRVPRSRARSKTSATPLCPCRPI
jgi:hypothetical protein